MSSKTSDRVRALVATTKQATFALSQRRNWWEQLLLLCTGGFHNPTQYPGMCAGDLEPTLLRAEWELVTELANPRDTDLLRGHLAHQAATGHPGERIVFKAPVPGRLSWVGLDTLKTPGADSAFEIAPPPQLQSASELLVSRIEDVAADRMEAIVAEVLAEPELPPGLYLKDVSEDGTGVFEVYASGVTGRAIDYTLLFAGPYPRDRQRIDFVQVATCLSAGLPIPVKRFSEGLPASVIDRFWLGRQRPITQQQAVQLVEQFEALYIRITLSEALEMGFQSAAIR